MKRYIFFSFLIAFAVNVAVVSADTTQGEVLCEVLYTENKPFQKKCVKAMQNKVFAKIITDYLSSF